MESEVQGWVTWRQSSRAEVVRSACAVHAGPRPQKNYSMFQNKGAVEDMHWNRSLECSPGRAQAACPARRMWACLRSELSGMGFCTEFRRPAQWACHSRSTGLCRRSHSQHPGSRTPC